jgi:hypothetical protein
LCAVAATTPTGDSLLLLPAFHLPLAVLTFHITTKLPGGRSPLLHHVFPMRTAPAGPDTPHQEVVDVFSLMKAEGWALSIDIAVNSDRTAAAVAAGGGAGGLATPCVAGVAGAPLGAPGGAAGSAWHFYLPYRCDRGGGGRKPCDARCGALLARRQQAMCVLHSMTHTRVHAR